ncbi:MAG: 30S ribosomal protein THX [Chitinophagaceae bacterium]
MKRFVWKAEESFCLFPSKSINFCIFADIFLFIFKKKSMGRGDKKTKKGKIFLGSYGKSRPRKTVKANAATASEKKEA